MNRRIDSTRRRALKFVGVAAGWLALGAHTPYGQWSVYRQKHLLILTSREDAGSYELGKAVAEILAERLPASAARVTRAPTLDRVASLLSTHQLDVAVMGADHARALFRGEGPFVSYKDVPLRRLIAFDRHMLVTLTDFPDRHAYQVAEAFDKHRHDLPVEAGEGPGIVPEIPLHPGAAAYFDGAPIPDFPPESDQGHED